MIFKRLNQYFSLAKTHLCLMLTVSTFAGYVTASQGSMSKQTLLTCLAVFLLSSGSAIINNIQDRFIDSQMTRTQNRPLPAKRVTVKSAALLAIINIFLAALLFYHLFQFSITPAILAFFALALYNGLYTPMKSKSVWAIIPGSLCGAIPPLIGWFASSHRGEPMQILLLTMIIWIWQFPHFWLKLMSFKDDYAGRESMLSYSTSYKVDFYIFSWIIAFVILTLASPLYGLISSTIGLILVLFLSISIITLTYLSLFQSNRQYRYKLMFIGLNFSLLVFMSISVLEQILIVKFSLLI